MSIWLENSAKNLLPLSFEKESFAVALKEWFYTGELMEYEEPEELCELCEKDGLRYHFQIKNAIGSTLWVGSKCIEKFGITIFDEDGIEITDNKETYLITQAKKKHIKEVILRLENSKPVGKKQGHPIERLDKYCIQCFYDEGKFDAKMINYLFLRLEEEGIKYRANSFKIDLRSDEKKRKLLNLKMIQYSRIKGALSVPQKNITKKNPGILKRKIYSKLYS